MRSGLEHEELSDRQPPQPSSGIKQSDQPLVHRFEDLCAGNDLILVTLGEAIYQLRRTRSGRLVLNK